MQLSIDEGAEQLRVNDLLQPPHTVIFQGRRLSQHTNLSVAITSQLQATRSLTHSL